MSRNPDTEADFHKAEQSHEQLRGASTPVPHGDDRSRTLEYADTNLTERCLAYAKQRRDRFFANKQALAQQSTVMSAEEIYAKVRAIIEAVNAEKAHEKRKV